MIRSMTGYGHSEVSSGNRKISVEMKSVNHRFLDVGIRMPRQLNAYDAALRTRLKKYASRGKIDLFITYENLEEGKQVLHYNAGLAGEYVKYMRQMAEDFHLSNDVRVTALARFPDILTIEETAEDEEIVQKLLFEAFDKACEQFVETRTAEGERLKEDLIAKADIIEREVAAIEERSPEIISEYRERLEKRIAEVLQDTELDESRIAAEVVIYADKICTDEERVRLRSHIASYRETLSGKNSDSIGRKLDFLAQEMNREANTILSKANDSFVSERGITLKTEIEKIREQIQNIE